MHLYLTCDNIMRLFSAGLVIMALALTSCSSKSVPQPAVALEPLPASAPQRMPKSPMLQANLQAGDALSDMLLRRAGSGSGILTTTLVNMENLDQSSPFGRMTMQQIGSRLSQNGFKVIESRLGADYRMEQRGGEFMLTRDTMRLLAQEYDAHAVLVGVYSVINGQTYISIRVVRFNDNAVIAAYEYTATGGLASDSIAEGGAPSYCTDSDAGACDPDGLWAQHAQRVRAFQ